MRALLSLAKSHSIYGLCLSILLTAACPFAVASPAASLGPTIARTSLTAEQLTQHLDQNLHKVEEFRFIKELAQAMGVRAYLFGGTAAGFLQYAKWDLQSLSGDTRFNRERFGYYFDQIYKATQDADIVVDGSAEQIGNLQLKVAKRFPHLIGEKSAWEIRSLRESSGDPGSPAYKEALLNDYGFLNQNSDSNSTALIEITDPTPENGHTSPRIRDLRSWNSDRSIFVEDALKEQITFFRSPNHYLTPRAKNGNNPEIFSVIRYLTKAFQYELKIPEADRQSILDIIRAFDPHRDISANTKRRFIDLSLKLYQQSPNVERAQKELQDLGLLEKLRAFAKASGQFEFISLFSKEPLKSSPLGMGSGRTAESLNIQFVSHETRNQEVFENITMSMKSQANVFISRPDHPESGEMAAYGAGFYTLHGLKGAVGNGLNITFQLAPEAREGTDFKVINRGGIILILNKAALRLVEQKYDNSGSHFLRALISSPELRSAIQTNKGYLTRHLRRIHRQMTPAEAAEINRDFILELQNTKLDVSAATFLRKTYLEILEDYASANVLNKFEKDYELEVTEFERLSFYVLPKLVANSNNQSEKVKIAAELIIDSRSIEDLMRGVFGDSTNMKSMTTPMSQIYLKLKNSLSDIDHSAVTKILLDYIQDSEDFKKISQIRTAILEYFDSNEYDRILAANPGFRDRLHFIDASAAILSNLNASNAKNFTLHFQNSTEQQKLSLAWAFLLSKPSSVDEMLEYLARSTSSPLDAQLDFFWAWLKDHRTELYYYIKTQKYETNKDLGPTSDPKTRLAGIVEMFCQGTSDFKLLNAERPFIDSLGLHLTLSSRLKLRIDKFYALTLDQQIQALSTNLKPGLESHSFLEALLIAKSRDTFDPYSKVGRIDKNLKSLLYDVLYNQALKKLSFFALADAIAKRAQMTSGNQITFLKRAKEPRDNIRFVLLVAELNATQPSPRLRELMKFVESHMSDLSELNTVDMPALKKMLHTENGTDYVIGFLTGLQLLHAKLSTTGNSFSETLEIYVNFCKISHKKGFFRFSADEENFKYFYNTPRVHDDVLTLSDFSRTASQLLKARESTAAIFDIFNNGEANDDSDRKVFKNSTEFLTALEQARNFSEYEKPKLNGFLQKLFRGRYQFRQFLSDTSALFISALIVHEGLRWGLANAGAQHLPLASQVALVSEYMRYTLAVLSGVSFSLSKAADHQIGQLKVAALYKKLMSLRSSPESQLERISQVGYGFLTRNSGRLSPPLCRQVFTEP